MKKNCLVKGGIGTMDGHRVPELVTYGYQLVTPEESGEKHYE